MSVHPYLQRNLKMHLNYKETKSDTSHTDMTDVIDHVLKTVPEKMTTF